MRLQLLMPNETPDPGNQSNKGKTGAPSNATAGVTYNVTVRLTDNYYNVESTSNLQVSPTMPGVQLVSTDPNDVESSYGNGNPQPLDGNTASATFGAVLRTSGTWTLSASDTGGTGTSYIADTSSNVVTVAGAPTKLLMGWAARRSIKARGSISRLLSMSPTNIRTLSQQAATPFLFTRAIFTMWIRDPLT